jgi:hypothetical protein
MRGSAAFRVAVAPGGALAGPWVRNSLWTAARAVPSLDLRFADNKSLTDAVTGASLITFTRASSGTFVGSDGLIKTATTNLLLRSEEFDDVSWIKSGNAPTITTNAATAPDGNTTADLFTRTVTGACFFLQAYTKAASALQYTFSVFAKKSVGDNIALRMQGTFPNKADVTFNLNTGVISTAATVAGGTFTGPSASITPYADGWYRLTLTATTDAATGVGSYVSFNSNNVFIDGTDSVSNSAGFLWGAQLEQSSSVGEYIPTTSTINSAPRFDHNPTTGESLGLLVEEQRTNSIRNNTMVGAVAGTPGTLPTNWAGSTSSNGVNREVIGVGTLHGINYIDVRFSGTPTATAFVNFVLAESNTSIAASNGQSWAFSTWAAIVGGDTTNISALGASIRFNDSSGVQLTSASISLSAAGSQLQRYSNALTAANASTAFVAQTFFLQFTIGAAIDITLRIGLPQLEQGAFATSVIPTTTATVTRSADVCSIGSSAFSGFYNQSQFTLYVDLTRSYSGNFSGFPNFASLTDGTASNNFALYGTQNNQNVTNFGIQSGGVIQNDFVARPTNFPGPNLIAQALATNSSMFAVNGVLTTEDTSITMPVGVNQLRIGSDRNGQAQWGGTIRRLCFWPTRLPNSTLQAVTQ